MLRRLLLAVLTLCLALPAAAMPLAPAAPAGAKAAHHAEMASCHEQQAPASHDKQQPQRAHDCIGCIAPLCRLPAVPAPPQLRSAPYIPVLASVLSGSARAPETPPPRF